LSIAFPRSISAHDHERGDVRASERDLSRLDLRKAHHAKFEHTRVMPAARVDANAPQAADFSATSQSHVPPQPQASPHWHEAVGAGAGLWQPQAH
jgi:hypothetical protein